MGGHLKLIRQYRLDEYATSVSTTTVPLLPWSPRNLFRPGVRYAVRAEPPSEFINSIRIAMGLKINRYKCVIGLNI